MIPQICYFKRLKKTQDLNGLHIPAAALTRLAKSHAFHRRVKMKKSSNLLEAWFPLHATNNSPHLSKCFSGQRAHATDKHWIVRDCRLWHCRQLTPIRSCKEVIQRYPRIKAQRSACIPKYDLICAGYTVYDSPLPDQRRKVKWGVVEPIFVYLL
jgi:hypothetical protein